MTMAWAHNTPADMLAALRVDMDLDDEVASVIGAFCQHPDPEGIAWLATIFYAAGWLDRNPGLRERLHQLYAGEAAPARYAPRNLSAT
jgi:hypothetical protein